MRKQILFNLLLTIAVMVVTIIFVYRGDEASHKIAELCAMAICGAAFMAGLMWADVGDFSE